MHLIVNIIDSVAMVVVLGCLSTTQLKQKRLSNVIERIKSHDSSCSVLGASQTLACRNRAQFKSDGAKLGYVAQGSLEIIDVTKCLVLNEVKQVHLRALRQSLPNNDWRLKKIVIGKR